MTDTCPWPPSGRVQGRDSHLGLSYTGSNFPSLPMSSLLVGHLRGVPVSCPHHLPARGPAPAQDAVRELSPSPQRCILERNHPGPHPLQPHQPCPPWPLSGK